MEMNPPLYVVWKYVSRLSFARAEAEWATWARTPNATTLLIERGEYEYSRLKQRELGYEHNLANGRAPLDAEKRCADKDTVAGSRVHHPPDDYGDHESV